MSTPGAADPARPSTQALESLVIGIMVVAFVAGGLWWTSTSTPSPTSRVATPATGIDPEASSYLGDATCSRCHPGESAAHARSGHARTLRPVAGSVLARSLDGTKAEDPERPGVTWDFSWLDGKLTSGRSDRGQVERSPIEYAFGSGHHATTFVSLIDRDPTRPIALEQRLSYFGHSKSLGLTPGQSLSGHASGNSPSGRVHTSGDTLKCFECHTTLTSDRGRAVLDEATMIPNISCESCHGPGKSHVEAARRGASAEELKLPQGPGRWTTSEQMRQCGRCHRTPEMVAPGSIRVDNPNLVRHQPVGLMQSACYLKSRGALSCVTCHDPHSKVSTDRTAYETSCLSCHRQAPQKACTVSPGSGCLDCHMPRRNVARGMIMTDHWIRRAP